MAVSKVVFGNKTLMDLTGDTVTPEKLLSGITAHGKDGEKITGTCTYNADTTDANAVADEILAGKTAYVNGNKVTGTMTNRGSVEGIIKTKDEVYTIQSGYHDGSGTVQIDSTEKNKIIPENIKEGVSLLGTIGTYTGEGVTAQSKNAVPYTDAAQTILPDNGYDYLSQVTVEKIKYVETENAQGGLTVTIGTVSTS